MSERAPTRAARAWLVLLLAVLAVTACTTPPARMSGPEGFARSGTGEYIGAISPEGVLFRLRWEANDPPQDLEFWSVALERHLVDSGYLRLDSGAFAAPAGEGTWHEWLAPVADEDWVYLTAIVVTGPWILVAEAAGPWDLYDAHRDSVRSSLETIEARR